MRARLILPGLLAAAALTLVGCGTEETASSSGDTEKTGPTASGSSASAQAGAGTAAVPKALRFTGTTVEGKPFDAATLAGKPVVLWFWAPWCPTCMRQSTAVRDTAARYQGKVNVVGIAGQDDLAAMRKFVKDQNVGSVPHVADEPGAVWKRFGVSAQSTYVVLDGAGKVTHKGYLDADGLAKQVAGVAG